MRSTFLNKESEREAGFTLLEVLISIVILAFISIGIYQAVTETYRVRETLSTEGDFHNGIRLAMNVLQRDLTLVYSPLSLLPKPSPSPSVINPQQQAQQIQAQQQLAALDPDLFQTFDFWLPAVDKVGIRPSRFVATENKVSFISNSHLRVYKDTPESEFSAITYELTRDDSDPNSQMLVKTESTDPFTLQKKNKSTYERTYPLLHGIKSFKYRFYRKDKDTWGPGWDNDKEEFKNLYPDMIELTLEVRASARLSFTGRFLFRPELPLRDLNPSM